jgi:hypothetical protein
MNVFRMTYQARYVHVNQSSSVNEILGMGLVYAQASVILIKGSRIPKKNPKLRTLWELQA